MRVFQQNPHSSLTLGNPLILLLDRNLHLWMGLNLLKIFRRCLSTDHSVRLIGNRGLVHN